MFKICAISDLHGNLINVDPCDVLLIAGDIVPLQIQRNSEATKRWFRYEFVPWAESLMCNKILLTWGNHDIDMWLDNSYYFNITEEIPKLRLNNKYLVELTDNYDKSNTIKIAGTPWCHQFGKWAYMKSDIELATEYNSIPNNLDILVTHDAPYGISDVLLQKGYYTGEHIGNKPLAEAILKKKPKYVVHGHLHSTSHEWETLGESKIINCSIKNENYNTVYKPIYFEI